MVAVGGPGRVVRVYDVADGHKVRDIKKHTEWITAIEFSPDGALLATGDRNGGLQVWEAATGREVALKILHPHNSSDQTIIARFKREAEACSRLRNPHTVITYDFDETEDNILPDKSGRFRVKAVTEIGARNEGHAISNEVHSAKPAITAAQRFQSMVSPSRKGERAVTKIGPAR